jgi:hypothetical protein
VERRQSNRRQSSIGKQDGTRGGIFVVDITSASQIPPSPKGLNGVN